MGGPWWIALETVIAVLACVHLSTRIMFASFHKMLLKRDFFWKILTFQEITKFWISDAV